MGPDHDREQVHYGDEAVERGAGGETHQVADGGPTLTTQQGVPVADDQNTLRVGRARAGAARGLPLPREDLPLRPRAHPRARRPCPRLRRARLLRDLRVARRASPGPTSSSAPASGRRCSCASPPWPATRARSTSPATCAASPSKFYTQEGNWDLVGNNIPVFFIQDAIKFPDLIHAVKQEPDRGFPQAQTRARQLLGLRLADARDRRTCSCGSMSDRAIPRSFRFMEGFGVHTFRLVNAEGRSTFVKFHWKPKLGMQSVVWNEAVKINGADPDFHRRDLWDAISAGDFPEWELGLQLFDDDVRRRVRLRRARPDEDHPRGGRCRSAASAGWCSTGCRTTSSPRPSRSRSARRTSSRASTSPTTRCCRAATSPTWTRSSSGSAARTSRRSRSTRRSARSRNFQQDGHMAMRNPRGRANYEPNSWGETAARARTRRAASSATPRRRRAQAPAAAGELRRPLQPGPPVLRQPDRGRAAPHRRRPSSSS